MGTQSKIGNPELFSGFYGRWLRRRRKQMWKMRERVNPWAVPQGKLGREIHPNANRKDVPHVGKKQKRKILNRTRAMAGLKTI
jgi:hypothetical protein